MHTNYAYRLSHTHTHTHVLTYTQVNADVNAFQRKFINEVRRCDEMERKLRFLYNELESAGIEVRPGGNVEALDPQGVFVCVCVCVCVCIRVLRLK